MKKFLSRTFSFLLVCAMFFSLCTSALAAEIEKPSADAQELFDMKGTNFKEMLRSDGSSKYFATYDHAGKNIHIRGSMINSSGQTVKVGLCHKVAPSGTFSYVNEKNVNNTSADLYKTSVDSLPTDDSYPNAQTYYVYFKNNSGIGTVSGYVKVFSDN